MKDNYISVELIENINKLGDYAINVGYKNISQAAKKIITNIRKQYFTVAIVGEFSRGKSSLINKLLGTDIMPVGDLPTTAMLTSVRYGENENICVYKNGNKIEEYCNGEDVWNNITDNKSASELVDERAVITVNDAWLNESGIEIIDTPGAGDLEEKRARVIGDALLSCDGAIVAISAASPFSMSEKLFIEQRLISHKIPFLMVVITKLDTIRENERAGVINYIRSKLQTLKTELPLFIADENYRIDNFDSECVGIEKIKKQINTWKNNPERIRLTEQFIAAKALLLSDSLKATLTEKKNVIDKDDKTILKAIEDKKLQVLQTSLVWENLRYELDGKSNECVDFLLDRVSVYKENLIEDIKNSLYASNDLYEWINKIYPSETRLGLAKLATKLSDDLKIRIAKDKQWFFEELLKNFKVEINTDYHIGSVNLEYKNSKNLGSVLGAVDDEEKIERYETIGAIATSVGLCVFLHIPPLIAVVGGKVLSRYFTKKLNPKTDLNSQREMLLNAVIDEIPNILTDATTLTRDRVKSVYKELSLESEKHESLWKNTQEKLISDYSDKVKDNGIDVYIDMIELENLQNQFKKFL